jgi:hypothetical protein
MHKLSERGIGLLLAAVAFAQSPEASLSGTVQDEQLGAVAGALVVLEDPKSAFKRETRTDSAGGYVLSSVPPGSYRLRVSAPGFAVAEIPQLVLNTGDRRSLTLTLKLGQRADSVTVAERESGVIETATVATVVDQVFVQNLPMNGRTFQNLIALTPGVTQTQATARNPGQFSVNGQRTSSNYLTIDGVSANFGLPAAPALAGSYDGTLPALTANGGTNSLISVDAMQEFQVQTSTFAPEFGRTPGGQISIVTRSGTNDLRGSLSNFFRNDVLDANDWFANRDGLPKPPVRQNNFGGVLGGPVVLPRWYNGKDRTFFFVAYEGLRLRQPQFATDAYPTLAARAQASPQNRPLVEAYPVPNQGDLGGGLGRFAATYSNPYTVNTTSIRLDHRLTERITLWGRFVEAPSEVRFRGSVQSYDLSLNSINSNRSDSRTVTLGSTQAFSPAAINETRFNWSRNRGGFDSGMDDLGGARPFTAAQLFPAFANPASGSVGILPQGLRGFAIGAQAVNSQSQWNFTDSFTLLRGRHQIKFGGDYRLLRPNIEAPLYQQYGVFVGLQGPLGLLNGRTATTIVSAFENLRAAIHNLSFYAQDSFRPSARLTVTFGVRWEWNPPLAGSNLPLYTATTDDPRTARLSGPGAALFPTQRDAFAPRLGVSYQLGRTAGFETTLRGGIGLFYDLPLGGLQALSSNPPYRRTRRLAGTLFPLPEAQAAPLPLSTDPPYDDVAVYARGFRLPRTTQYNFTIDQGLGGGRILTTSYIGAHGRRLQRRDSLAGTPGSLFRGFSILHSDAESDFHSFQTQFRQALRRGVQVMVSYAWAHSIDTASDNVAFNAPEPDGPRANRASSDFDVRQVLNGALSWDLPGRRTGGPLALLLRDWGVDSLFRVQTGFPVDVFSRAVINGATFAFRPDRVAGAPLYLEGPQYAGGRAINRAAFAIPPNQTRNGTLGRNAARGFPLRQIDFTARRTFVFGERCRLQFRAEFFNLLNRPNFASPEPFLLSPLFGQSTQMFGRGLGQGGVNGGLNPLYAVGGPRSTQLALRLTF